MRPTRSSFNMDEFWNGLVVNATNRINARGGDNTKMVDNLQRIINDTVRAISGRDTLSNRSSSDRPLPAQVFVRFGADGDGGPGGGLVSYLQCNIVDVVKDLDVAVLKIVDPPSSLKPLT